VGSEDELVKEYLEGVEGCSAFLVAGDGGARRSVLHGRPYMSGLKAR